MWIPLIASVGVGAATYYTLSKKNQTIGQTMEKVLPFVSEMSSGNTSGHMGNMDNMGNMGNNGMS